jgi:hypothetical protein
MQDREHRAVAHRIQEFVRVPARCERAGFRFAVTDDTRGDEIGVVEHRAERVDERVAELATFVDRAGSGRRGMTRDAARERELPEQLAQAVLVAGDVRVELCVRPFEIRAGDDGRTAVTRAAHEDHVEVKVADHAVEVRVEQVEPGGGAPVPEEPRLRVLEAERFTEQRVVEQVDLTDGEIVRRAPPRVDQLELTG